MRNITFSAAIRNELCRLPLTARHCVLAEISAMMDVQEIGSRLKQLLQHAFGIDYIDKRVRKAAEFSMAVMHPCCKRAYARGSYIVSGTCNDPNKSYHLEYAMPQSDLAKRLYHVLKSFELSPKLTQRKNNMVLYFKESESIVNVLNIMEAHKSMLEYENVRVLKEMRNDVNRKVNFETANLTKTVNAAVNQLDDIQYIADTVGLTFLSKPLKEAAQLRLAYETASLQEIGKMLDPPVGKSGVNHRLRKISEIAEKLREDVSSDLVGQKLK